MAEKCKFCEKRAWDDCVVCHQPVCEMHGVIIRQDDIVCMPCKRELLAKEEDDAGKKAW